MTSPGPLWVSEGPFSVARDRKGKCVNDTRRHVKRSLDRSIQKDGPVNTAGQIRNIHSKWLLFTMTDPKFPSPRCFMEPVSSHSAAGPASVGSLIKSSKFLTFWDPWWSAQLRNPPSMLVFPLWSSHLQRHLPSFGLLVLSIFPKSSFHSVGIPKMPRTFELPPPLSYADQDAHHVI